MNETPEFLLFLTQDVFVARSENIIYNFSFENKNIVSVRGFINMVV